LGSPSAGHGRYDDAAQESFVTIWEKRAFKIGDTVPGPGGETCRVTRLIAIGGYSEVYEVACEPSGKRYAIKALRLKHADNAKTLERTLREAKTLYQIQHPNVVRVYFIGVRREDELLYMVMDLLVGRNVRELQRDLTAALQRGAADVSAPRGRIPVSWVLEIMVPVCAGLEKIHAVAIHRDLKPENIYIGDDGVVHLLDIGSAKFPKSTRLTTHDMTIGTPQYMSPEQLYTPDKIDARSDLFAIGTMLYELLSGAPPFDGKGMDGEDTRVLGNKIIWQPHKPLLDVAKHLPEHIAAIVEKLLEKDPGRRYGSAAAVRDALVVARARFVRELGDLAPPTLAETVAKIPRTPAQPEAAEPIPVPTGPHTTNPFITVSLPPELPAAPAASPAPAKTEELEAQVAAPPVAIRGLEATSAPSPRPPVEVTTEKLPVAAEPSPAPAPAEDIDQQARIVRRMVDRLPEDLRTAFILAEVREMPVAEVAEALGIAEVQAQERVHEARTRLASMLSGAADERSSLGSHVREVPAGPVHPPSGAARTAPLASRQRPVPLLVVAGGLAVLLAGYVTVRMTLRAGAEPTTTQTGSSTTSTTSSGAGATTTAPQEDAALDAGAAVSSATATTTAAPAGSSDAGTHPARPSAVPPHPTGHDRVQATRPTPTGATPTGAPARNRLFGTEN
jgi:serine/threonine-protein kinase